MTLAERFWSKVDKTADCWAWTASLGSHGYGQFYLDGRPQGAHRVAWLLTNGLVPEGKELDHLCRNRACVRPEHLEAVPRRVNFLRGEHPTAVAVRNGTCVKGHPVSVENTYVKPSDGRRECRVCRRENERRRYHAKRAAA